LIDQRQQEFLQQGEMAEKEDQAWKAIQPLILNLAAGNHPCLPWNTGAA
jgi:hypothetical protein